MTASQPNLLELAKQGDARAIAALMNRQLQPKGITAKVALKDMCLQVMLESASTPNQEALVTFLRKGIAGLGATSIERVKIYGKQVNEDFPSWNQEFELIMQADSFRVNIENQSDSKASITKTAITPSSQITHQSSYSSAKVTTLVKEKTSEEKMADWIFGIFLILAIVSLFINWLLAFLLFGIACLAAGGTKEGKAASEKQKLEAEHKLEAKQHELDIQQKPVVTVEPLVIERVESQLVEMEQEVRCPKCSSTQLTVNKKGYSVGKAAVGIVLTGGIGLLGGFIGSNKIMISCLKCGHQWKPNI